MLCVLAACASNRFAVEHVWGGVHGAVADPWYVEDLASAQLAPDGRSAVLVSSSGHAVIVASPSGARIADVTAHASSIRAVAYSADGRRFAFFDVARECTAVWSVRPARELSCIAGDIASFLALSPDGQAVAVFDHDGQLSRWSIASRSKVWSAKVPSQIPTDGFAWPVPDLILVGSGSLRARDAATGASRWVHPDAGRYLGVSGGDAVMTGGFYDGPGSGPIARIDLATGRLRDRSGGDVEIDPQRGGAVLADGTVIVIDRNSVARRVKLGGREIASQVFPDDTNDLSAARDGQFALVVTHPGLVPWNLSAGTPGAPYAPIRALDADERGVIAIAADGSVIARDRDGDVQVRGQMRSPDCAAAAVSATARLAACAVELYQRDERSGALKTHEWLALDGGARGALDLNQGEAIAIDNTGAIWAAGQRQATWLDPKTGAAVASHPIDGVPRTARVIGDGQSVAYGGWDHIVLPPDANQPDQWSGYGLHVMTRDGAVTTLEPQLAVVALDSDRAGTSLAVVTLGDLELWRSAGGAWTRQWSASAEHQPSGPACSIHRFRSPPSPSRTMARASPPPTTTAARSRSSTARRANRSHRSPSAVPTVASSRRSPSATAACTPARALVW